MRSALASGVVFLLGLGQSISGWQEPWLGYVLMSLGGLAGVAFLVSHERVVRRIPFTIVRKETEEPPGGLAAAAPMRTLNNELQELARRGHRLRRTATISNDGASGPIEVWEDELALALENAGRHDLLSRLEQMEPSEYARRIWSRPSATRGRLARKSRVLGEIVLELTDHTTTSG